MLFKKPRMQQKEPQIVINMKKKISLFIIVSFSLLSCKPYKTNRIVPEEYKVLNAHFTRPANDGKLFYNTLINMSTGDLLVEKITVGQLNFHRFKNGFPKQVDFDTIFNTKSINYLKKNFSELEIEELDRTLIRSIDVVNNDNNRFVVYTTKPIITKDKEYALFYTETKSSGNLWVYKKGKKDWNFFSTSPLWIE